jgi:hypothetical protein
VSDPLESDETLPPRDWILLPLVVFAVTFVFLGAAELAARAKFREQGELTCGVLVAPGTTRNKPNCVSFVKYPESPLVEYRFNDCGYRSTKSCAAKPPGTLRIALIGTSLPMGLNVSYSETFASLTEAALNRACHQDVEVQNLGALGGLQSQIDSTASALRLSPDVIVLTVMPFDVQGSTDAPKEVVPELQTWVKSVELAWLNFKLQARKTKLMFAAEHYMFLNEQTLYRTFLSSGRSHDLMSAPPTASGEQRYAEFASILDGIMAKIHGSGVPLVVVAVPNRVAAAIVSNHATLEATDATLFGRRISEIAAQRGAFPVDTTPEFASSPHAELLFYSVDSHPNSGGHEVIARALLKRLTDGSIPQLAACRSGGQ